jgi:hypothetical protein
VEGRLVASERRTIARRGLVFTAVLAIPGGFHLATRLAMSDGSLRAAMCLLLTGALGAVVLLAPGVAVLLVVERKVGRALAPRVAMVLAGAVAVHWIGWWVWVVDARAGRGVAACAWIATSLVVAARAERVRRLGPEILVLSLAPAAAVAFVGAMSWHGGLAVAPEIASEATFATADNFFPRVWIERVDAGEDLSEPALGGWPPIDRPPVQAAWTIPGYVLASNHALAYEVLGATLQALVVPAVLLVLLAFGLRHAHLFVALGLVVATPFVAFNTVFTWPKLLPAALVLVVIAVLIERRDVPGTDWAALGVLTGLSAVAHPGGLLALPSLLALVMWLRAWPRSRRCWGALLAAGAAVAAPWLVYRGVIDTTRSVLLPFHLGGGQAPTDARSLGEFLVDRYRELGFRGWLAHRWDNAKTLVGVDQFSLGWGTWLSTRFNLRSLAMHGPLWAGGVLLAASPVLAFRRRYASVVFAAAMAALAGIGLWCVIEWGPPATGAATLNGPYALIVLFAVSVAAALVVVAPWLARVALCVQAVMLLVIVLPMGADRVCTATNMCFPPSYDTDAISGSSFDLAIASVVVLAVVWIARAVVRVDDVADSPTSPSVVGDRA